MKRVGNVLVDSNGDILGVFTTFRGRETYVPLSQVYKYPSSVRKRVKKEVTRYRVNQLLNIIANSNA